jgi:hypothetical protein
MSSEQQEATMLGSYGRGFKDEMLTRRHILKVHCEAFPTDFGLALQRNVDVMVIIAAKPQNSIQQSILAKKWNIGCA